MKLNEYLKEEKDTINNLLKQWSKINKDLSKFNKDLRNLNKNSINITISGLLNEWVILKKQLGVLDNEVKQVPS